MATHTRIDTHFHLNAPGFFERPISRWLSILALGLSIGLCAWVAQQFAAPEPVLKVALFTLPSAGYLLFRSFVRQA